MTPAEPHPGSPTAFEGLVDDYDRGRPDYPDELFAALPPLAGATVVELGAGTGIATRGLLSRGARLVATDLGPRMLGRLRSRSPQAAAAVARAERLPIRSRSVDLVCGAQMWHWVDVSAAAAEVGRVLRPGGALAIWWNEVDAGREPWFDAQQARIESLNPLYRRIYRQRDYAGELCASGCFAEVRGPVMASWSRVVDLDTYLAWLRSKSYVDAIPRPERDEFLAAERASLGSAFGGDAVTEPFVTWLWVATTPTEAPGPGRGREHALTA